MSINAKYQYTHFIYPFIIQKGKYVDFIESILKKEDKWSLKIHEYEDDEESYDFFLPYMRKFLFPTLYWNKSTIKSFKSSSRTFRKSLMLSKLSCVTFNYNLSRIKKGCIEIEKDYTINFEISDIKLICFEQGVCFFDIKMQIDDRSELINFNKVLDFNYYLRELTPKMIKSKLNDIDKCIKGINIAKFIKDNINGYENNSIDKIYYDKMFTYSYVCVDGWENDKDFDDMKNDFYKFQYVMDSKSSAVFNKYCNKLIDNVYSRWKYSVFGFSRESGVVFVSDKEKYDITRMPYNFEKRYLYMLLLAFYQRITLINFSQDLLSQDKTLAKRLKSDFTKFTHFSWFSQITNSEHGMEVWKRWQQAFELQELFDEVHREYIEYYDFVASNGQDKINVILILLYIINVVFAGLQILTNTFSIQKIQGYVIVIMIIAIVSYPMYLILSWIKHKLESKF